MNDNYHNLLEEADQLYKKYEVGRPEPFNVLLPKTRLRRTRIAGVDRAILTACPKADRHRLPEEIYG